MLKTYLHTENEVAMSSHSKVIALISRKIALRAPDGTDFQPLLAFTMRHIPTKLHQFLIGSFQDFVRTDEHTDRQTDRCRKKQYLLAACTQVISIFSRTLQQCTKAALSRPCFKITVLEKPNSWPK